MVVLLVNERFYIRQTPNAPILNLWRYAHLFTGQLCFFLWLFIKSCNFPTLLIYLSAQYLTEVQSRCKYWYLVTSRIISSSLAHMVLFSTHGLWRWRIVACCLVDIFHSCSRCCAFTPRVHLTYQKRIDWLKKWSLFFNQQTCQYVNSCLLDVVWQVPSDVVCKTSLPNSMLL